MYFRIPSPEPGVGYLILGGCSKEARRWVRMNDQKNSWKIVFFWKDIKRKIHAIKRHLKK